jgi:hypothetical protein
MTESVFDNALLLGVWWSLWTLFDTYLIPFTPWSELAVLAVCLAVAAPKVVGCVRERVSRGRVKLDEALESI